MKILHTSDWHIGKLVHGLHMTEDQSYLLNEMMNLIKQENIQILIIAGDVYDRSIPPTSAVELLDEVLTEIVMVLKVKVIVIAGNHDSPDRLNFGSKILKDHGLHIFGHLDKTIKPVIISDEFGPINFYPIPYAEPVVVKQVYDNDSIKNHDSAMASIVEGIMLNLDESIRNIAIGHGFVMGTDSLEESESERPLAIGGSEHVSVDYFEAFDYVALGHLHRPQKVKHDHIRYAGSLLKYSFSEALQKKSFTIIDIKEKGNLKINQVSLKPLRDLRVIKGDLNHLMSPEVVQFSNPKDYISAILTDKGKLYEPMKKLRSVYPNMLQLEKEKIANDLKKEILSAADIKSKGPEVLFREFYSYVTDEPLSNDMMKSFGHMYEVIKKEERDK